MKWQSQNSYPGSLGSLPQAPHPLSGLSWDNWFSFADIFDVLQNTTSACLSLLLYLWNHACQPTCHHIARRVHSYYPPLLASLISLRCSHSIKHNFWITLTTGYSPQDVVCKSKGVFKDFCKLKLVTKLFSNKTLKLRFVTLVSMRIGNKMMEGI